MTIAFAKNVNYICPAGHRSSAQLGQRCGAVLNGSHKGHRCQERVIVEPEIVGCPWCSRGILLDTDVEGLERPVCSGCGAMGRPSPTVENRTKNRRSEPTESSLTRLERERRRRLRRRAANR
jgi:hypothetical protein